MNNFFLLLFFLVVLISIILLLRHIFKEEKPNQEEDLKQEESTRIAEEITEKEEEERLERLHEKNENLKDKLLQENQNKYGDFLMTTVVVGTYYRSDEEKFQASLVSIGDVLSLKREKNNKYDENAVKVSTSNFHIGYIPADDAFELADVIDSGTKVITYAIDVPIDENYESEFQTEHIRIAIYKKNQ